MLAAGVLVAINPGKRSAQARDAQRKHNLAQIDTALKEFLVDKGEYPPYPGGVGWVTFIQGGCSNSVLDALINGGYLKTIPEDPKAPTYRYVYQKTGLDSYRLGSHLENTADPKYITENWGGCTPFDVHYKLTG